MWFLSFLALRDSTGSSDSIPQARTLGFKVGMSWTIQASEYRILRIRNRSGKCGIKSSERLCLTVLTPLQVSSSWKTYRHGLLSKVCLLKTLNGMFFCVPEIHLNTPMPMPTHPPPTLNVPLVHIYHDILLRKWPFYDAYYLHSALQLRVKKS